MFITEKSENRHITCKLPKHFTAGHRVWIAIKPSDTGKTLAHRIHVVATLRTMKITGIKTAAGRDVPLDNTPVFPTWQDIETFHDGELWTFESGSEPENFLIQGGKFPCVCLLSPVSQHTFNNKTAQVKIGSSRSSPICETSVPHKLYFAQKKQKTLPCNFLSI